MQHRADTDGVHAMGSREISVADTVGIWAKDSQLCRMSKMGS